MLSLRAAAPLACAALMIAACDKDPSGTAPAFRVAGCPSGTLDVNAPITLSFIGRVSPTTVTNGNIVVSNAVTGVEIPGNLSLTNTAAAATVAFTPLAPLPFGTKVRVRVQNVLADSSNTPLSNGPFVCELRTGPAPITELFWNTLPQASGQRLQSVTLTGPDSGFVISERGPIFRRRASEFEIAFRDPYYSRGFDVAFVSPNQGYGSYIDFRGNRDYLLETLNAGASWDTVTSCCAGSNLVRLFVRQSGPAATDFFHVAGGGTAGSMLFLKFRNATRTYAVVGTTTATGEVQDFSFPSDTINGAAVTRGAKSVIPNRFGKLWVTQNSGNSWEEVPGSTADVATSTYRGVARTPNGTIWVVGGNGFVAKFTATGTYPNYTMTPVLQNALTIFDPTNPESLLYTDVEFLPGSDTRGWIVGAQQVGVVSGVPKYQGVIFETKDGGATWTRQGVREAPNYGAQFQRLNRLAVHTSGSVWAAGDNGTVIEYKPTP